MTVTFHSWQDGRQPGAPYTRCSPNLDAITAEIGKLFGGYSLGCYVQRAIRGGTSWSSHSFGAAKDWRIDDDKQRDLAIKWLVDNHDVLGVQAVHDYVGSRIWRAGRGWRAQSPSSSGMGQTWAKWLHIETPPDRWGDYRPVPERFAAAPPELIVHAPPYVPTVLKIGIYDPHRVRWLQQICNERVSAGLVVDGGFGKLTDAAVRKLQTMLKVGADGVYGRITATALAEWFTTNG